MIMAATFPRLLADPFPLTREHRSYGRHRRSRLETDSIGSAQLASLWVGLGLTGGGGLRATSRKGATRFSFGMGPGLLGFEKAQVGGWPTLMVSKSSQTAGE